MLKIVADENIPCVDAFFSPYGQVQTFPGRDMRAEDVKDADILLVRSVTKVNASLLEGSSVRFVGTCTIGVDHLDKPYLSEQGIQFASAPGCNAGGVVQYALSAMAHLKPDWRQKRIGIIGCGNVGGRLYRTLERLGVDCVAYDPLLDSGKIAKLTSWEDVLRSDIICAHTPLTHEGPYPSFHMLGELALSAIADGTLLLNAGRGEVIDNNALHRAMSARRNISLALDVWEDEPNVFLPLVEHVKIGSPHIAGYSFEGRLNGSKMIHQSLGQFLNIDQAQLDKHEKNVLADVLGEQIPIKAGSLNDAIQQTYPIFEDDKRFREAMAGAEPQKAFDVLRKSYWQRREFSQYIVECESEQLKQELECVGFSTVLA